jgi:Zn-dependent peptidase ImmA (M78 family)
LADSSDVAIEDAARLLNDLVRAEVELEDALGIERARNYPPERPLLPGDVRTQAEQDSQELRDWLGLGAAPVLDILSLLDLQLGIRVYLRRLDSKVSGLFAFDENVGACMLLNANHPADRIAQSGAHELGHFVSTRRQTEVLTTREKFLSREERYANAFARCFIAPARVVRQRFSEITAGQSHLTRRHVILLASATGLSREALVRRLEELSLVKQGTWDWFELNGGITDQQAREVLGELPNREPIIAQAQGLIPPRLSLLAGEAWRRGIYSEGQLARLLNLNRLELRELLDSVQTEESEANELSR